VEDPKGSFNILMADDDEDDFLLIQEAFKESGFGNPLYFVQDGDELMAFLHRKGKYLDPVQSPRPDLILLDLNMPKMSGREALKEIKNDPQLRAIPIVIITTSHDKRDKLLGRQLGVCAFVTKPDSFEELVEIVRTNGMEWLNTCR
jgi:CheY-like chemotaxis protein